MKEFGLIFKPLNNEIAKSAFDIDPIDPRLYNPFQDFFTALSNILQRSETCKGLKKTSENNYSENHRKQPRNHQKPTKNIKTPSKHH